MSSRYRRLHVNVKNTMRAGKIQADVVRAFALDADLITFNEAKSTAHRAIRQQASEHGYGAFIPSGPAGQVPLAWRSSRYEVLTRRSKAGRPVLARAVQRVNKGKANVQPNRYVNTVDLRDRETGLRVCLAGTHTIASGWTGSKRAGGVSDAWRRAQWGRHVRAMARVLKAAARRCDVVDWAGDMNRPRRTWKGRVFWQFRVPGAATSLVVDTDATHGRQIYDYAGILSLRRRVVPVKVSTPAFNSDHDGILVDYKVLC